jgi:hypothetical protein
LFGQFDAPKLPAVASAFRRKSFAPVCRADAQRSAEQ